MKTIEMFAGIGGFRIAADRCGHETIWANDKCGLACRIYATRFGKAELMEGDVEKYLDAIPPHELLTGGFPCQPFSSAGKKQGIEDPRGTLFSHIVETLRHHRPKFFVLENVKRLLTMDRGAHFATILSSLAELDYTIEWRLLNALHFGLAQNRQRIFILGALSDGKSDHPFKTKARLSIRLASEADLSHSRHFDLSAFSRMEKWRGIAKYGVKFPAWGVAWKGRFYSASLTRFSAHERPTMLKSVLQKESEIDRQFDFTESTLDRIEKSEAVNKFIGGVEILSNQGGGARMGYTVFGINGVAPTLTATPSRHYERYKIGNRYRRLTNIEYARLQGFPDDHCSAASLYAQYGLYGNAVPPPMAEWVMRQLECPGIQVGNMPSRPRQRELFADA